MTRPARPAISGSWILPYSLALGLLVFSVVVSAQAPSPAQPGEQGFARLSADDFECPEGTEIVRVESLDGRFAAWWCELREGGKVARHGPYLELFDDGSVYRQGAYLRGLQAGWWVRFSRSGEIEHRLAIRPGEAGRFIPQPEDLCPPGTTRRRSTAYDHRRHLQSECFRLDEDGDRVLEGPYVEWDEETTPGGARYLLRSLMTYKDGERHGPHKVFAGPFQRESLVEDEVFVDGQPDGESRAFYLDGEIREIRSYRDGRFHGERVSFYPGGRERWRLVYENGTVVEQSGDLKVAGEACPAEAVPIASPDGLELRCARRHLHFQEINGPFERRDPDGNVMQSGLYRRGEKVELWQDGGEKLPPQVGPDVLVAEVTAMLGESPYALPSPPEPPQPPWKDKPELFRDPEAMEAALEAHNERVRLYRKAKERPIVDIWFRDRRTNGYPYPKTKVEDGRIKVFGLSPGRYYLRIEHDAERSNPMQYPGDLTSSKEFDVRLGEVVQVEAPLLYSLHLTAPYDNAEPIPGWGSECGKENVLPGRGLRFAWQPPPGQDPDGIEWHYIVRRTRCEPHGREVIKEGRTYDTSVLLDLPTSAHGEGYEFVLLARRGDKVIGELMSFGKKGGHGWSIRFRTESPRLLYGGVEGGR